MAENNLDMFKLVQEVEKQKQSTLEDVFSQLDSVRNNDMREEKVTIINRTTAYSSTSNPDLVTKPTIPNHFGDYDTRFEAFKAIIEYVSYGTTNVNDYVSGHRDALEKYYRDAYSNQKDLYLIEARVNDEISRYVTRNDLYEKGYYDGLFYVLKALKRSKELLEEKIGEALGKVL